MSGLKNMVKAIVPEPVRRAMRTKHREFVFRRAMKEFLADPEASLAPGSRVSAALIYGWGNEYWSALDEYLRACLRETMTGDGPILECGSGLSTILIGVVAKRHGRAMWSLEHTPEWGEKVARNLKEYQIDSVRLDVHPLKDYGDFTWYDPEQSSMPAHFAMVVCDGPPGDTRGGRYGLGAVMRDRLKPGCVILLDDAEREQERAIGDRWSQELGGRYEILGTAKPYLRLDLEARHAGASV